MQIHLQHVFNIKKISIELRSTAYLCELRFLTPTQRCHVCLITHVLLIEMERFSIIDYNNFLVATKYIFNDQ